MPAQGNEATLLRRKTGDTESTLGSAEVDLLFDEAEAQYGKYSRTVILQAVVVARLAELFVAASRAVTYKQNEASENLSDIAKRLGEQLERAEGRLQDLIDDEQGAAVRVLHMRRVPSRDRSKPHG